MSAGIRNTIINVKINLIINSKYLSNESRTVRKFDEISSGQEATEEDRSCLSDMGVK